MLGRTTGDIRAWERAWDLYSGTFGVACGRLALSQLSTWVGALSETACRRIEVSGQGCRKFCRDECVAISMIAACQHQTCPAVRTCSFTLIEPSQIDGVVAHAQNFATTLAGLDRVLLGTYCVILTRLAKGDLVTTAVLMEHDPSHHNTVSRRASKLVSLGLLERDKVINDNTRYEIAFKVPEVLVEKLRRSRRG